MSIELQVQSSVLAAITARAIQKRLLTTCFAAFDSVYIDHVDVADTPVAIAAANATVRLRVPLDVFVVRRNDVLTAPNRVPVGATTPAGTVVVVLEMAAVGAVVSLRCVDADLGMLGVTLGASASAAKATLIQAIGSPLTTDCSDAWNKLGQSAPQSARIELVAGVVCVRFDSTANAAIAYLPAGQEWGLFLNGAAMVRFAKSKIAGNLAAQIGSLTLGAQWRSLDGIPRVALDFSGKLPPLSSSATSEVSGRLTGNFSFTPSSTQSLRTTVHWLLEKNPAKVASRFIDNELHEKMRDAMDPEKFGGAFAGDQAFTIDTILPEIPLGGARLRYNQISVFADGLTIGGSVKLPVDQGQKKFQPCVKSFGQPHRLEFCSMAVRVSANTKTGNTNPGDATTTGSVRLENSGAFHDLEIISPGKWIAPYIQFPAAFPEIKLVIPSVVAAEITSPVRFIVHTAWGVRLIDLGTPPRVIVDATGNATSELVAFGDNCGYAAAGPDNAHGIDWGVGIVPESGSPESTVEISDWSDYLGRQRGLDVQLVTLGALEPGEIIQFRSADHRVDITADSKGRAVVPVLLPVADDKHWASLVRANRRSIAGHFTIRTALLVNQARLPATARQRFRSTDGGSFLSSTRFESTIDHSETGPQEALALVEAATIARASSISRPVRTKVNQLEPSLALAGNGSGNQTNVIPSVEQTIAVVDGNSRPPRSSMHQARSANDRHPFFERVDYSTEIESLFAVPGFTDASIALATMMDGSTLILDLNEAGVARVAGTFVGPIGALEVSGNWSPDENSERLSVYRSIKN
ncbi:MAG TPA: hypothetical protein VGM64_13870 [Lacunisphaera sp.]|jgi:hypothetical protein